MSDEHLDIIDTPDGLLADVRSMIEQTRARVARETYSMLYECTAISRKPEEVARAELAQLREDDRLAPALVFKDPYVLDFLGLNDRYLERDLEDAILREIETFLLNSAMASPSSAVRSAFRSIPTTSTSTFCFTIAVCAVLSP